VCLDPSLCIGCGTCVRYCPIGMVFLDPEIRKAYKCELCQGDPLCVAACPTGALELVKKELPQGKPLPAEEIPKEDV